eukprot:jgi/Hompol1/6141/HPOL_000510-RA
MTDASVDGQQAADTAEHAKYGQPLHPVLGLAASQVGHPIRLIAFQITDSQTLREKHIDKPVPRTFIVNPEMTILDKTPPEQWPIDYEFCESIPGYSGLVRRANHIYVKGLDLEGKPMIMSVKGFVARVVQHEMDHLNGELFVDKMERQSFRHDDYVDKYEMFKK